MTRRRASLVLIIAVLTTAFCLGLGGAARADDWTRVGAGGLDGNYNRLVSGTMCSAVFNGDLYIGTGPDWGGGCQVWRQHGGTWEKVCENGFGDRDNYEATSMLVYGSYLYVGVYNQYGGQVWRTAGVGGPPFTDWVQVNQTGFGGIGTRVYSMAVFDSHIYAGLTGSTNGCQIWRTAAVGGPPYTDWVQVNSNGFGDNKNQDAYWMTVFDSALHVGTYNGVTGAEVWRTEGAGGPPYTDWTQVNANGFGEGATCYATQSVRVVGSTLFAGVSASGGCRVYRTQGTGGPPYTDWTKVNTNGFGDPSNDISWFLETTGSDLYVGTRNTGTGGEVWRTAFSGGPPYTDWTQVNADGFGSASNISASPATFLGSQLYVSTSNSSAGGSQVLRSALVGGPPYTDWTQVNVSGFTTNTKTSVTGSVFFNGDLYVGAYSLRGCEVWRYHDSTWTAVSAAGFGDINNKTASSMAVFGGCLYVGTDNYQGCEVWRTAGAGGPPFTDWVQVNADGFGSANNDTALSMTVFGSALHVGTLNETSGAGVWRTAGTGGPPFTDWVQVNATGFGDANNGGVVSMVEFDSELYVGTRNLEYVPFYDPGRCEVWKSAGSGGPPYTDWVQVNSDGFGDSLVANARLAVLGSKLYAATSENGKVWRSEGVGGPPFSDWTLVNTSRFGDSNNADLPVIGVFDSKLYVGTWNWITGAEIWKTSEVGGPPYTDWTQANSDGFGSADSLGAQSLVINGSVMYAGVYNEQAGAEVWGTGAMPPGITGINPDEGTNTGSVSVTIAGSFFVDGATCQLTKTGQTAIGGTGVTFVNSNTITCGFDLTGKATG
jgi:hypothetical protein